MLIIQWVFATIIASTYSFVSLLPANTYIEQKYWSSQEIIRGPGSSDLNLGSIIQLGIAIGISVYNFYVYNKTGNFFYRSILISLLVLDFKAAEKW